MNRNKVAKVQMYIDSYINFSGSILLAESGKIIFKKSYGMADFENNVLNENGTIYRIASLAKQFTAVCIMMLEEKGLINVNDRLIKFIPSYPRGQEISIHNLLSMSTGIPNYLNDILFQSYNFTSGVYKGGLRKDEYFTPIELINLFQSKPLNFKPSTDYEYSNSNYVILGYIIEKVSNISYEEFVKNNIFIPLHMTNSGYDHNKEMKNKAIGYDSLDPKPVKIFSYDTSILYSAGGLYSSTEDLYKWEQGFYKRKLLKKHTLEKLFKPYTTIANLPSYAYAYGWIVNEKSEKTVAEHEGMLPGFLSYILHDEESKRTIIILCNNVEFYSKFPELYYGLLNILKR